MGPTSGPSGADRNQVGPMLTPWILLSGHGYRFITPRCGCVIINFTHILHITVPAIERHDVLNHRHLVCSTVCSGAHQRKHQSSALLTFCEENPHRCFPSQMANNAENISIWWRHHEIYVSGTATGSVPVKQHLRTHVKSLWPDKTTKTKQSTGNPWLYFMGYIYTDLHKDSCNKRVSRFLFIHCKMRQFKQALFNLAAADVLVPKSIYYPGTPFTNMV